MRGNIGNYKSPTTETEHGFEVFSTSGFCTLTGNALDYIDILGLEDTVAEVSPEIRAICAVRFPKSQRRKVDPDDFMIGREPKIGLSVSQMGELLSVLGPVMPREDWIKVGMALHHNCDSDDGGFYIWDDWSSNGEKYPSEESLRTQWDSFERRKGSGQHNVRMAMATVMMMMVK
jgi:hypothetical protein